MASLPKPAYCSECLGTAFRREKLPERWVCITCNHTEVTRPSRRLATSKCRRCEAPRGSKPFKPGKNLCMECSNAIHSEWRAANIEHVRAQRSRPEEKARRQATVRRCIQRTTQSFLKNLVFTLQRRSRRNKIRKGQNPIILDVQIDLNFVTTLWEQQDGKCKLLGIPMLCKFGSLRTVSIDRIDSSKGYLPDNVQLVCQFINSGKRHHPNEDVLAILADYRLTMYSETQSSYELSLPESCPQGPTVVDQADEHGQPADHQ